MNIYYLPNELMSLIGLFFDMNTLVSIYKVFHASIFKNFVCNIKQIIIQDQRDMDNVRMFRFFDNICTISIIGNFSLHDVILYISDLEHINTIHLINHKNFYIYKNLFERLPSLQELYLDNVDIEQGDIFIINSNKNLKYLTMRSCPYLEDTELDYLSSSLKNLLFLDISDCHMLPDTHSMQYLARLTNLEQLNISRTIIDDTIIEFIFNNFPNLTSLDISENNITDEWINRIDRTFPKLQELNIENTNISDIGIEKIPLIFPNLIYN